MLTKAVRMTCITNYSTGNDVDGVDDATARDETEANTQTILGCSILLPSRAALPGPGLGRLWPET